MREEVARLRDELRAEEDRSQSWRIASAAAELSCSRACRERDEARDRVLTLEAAMWSILCAADTVLLGDLDDLPRVEAGAILGGISQTAAVALGFYDPRSETSGKPERE